MGRAPCCDKTSVKKGPWAPEEDAILKNYLEKHGTGGNWISMPLKAGLKRCGKSCRLRWLNYLRPDIKRGGFTEEEDMIICTLYGSIGSRWSVIASQLPGRTDNDIKNYWNTRLKKKLFPISTNTYNNNEISEISASIPKVEPYDYGNISSACFNTSSSALTYPIMVEEINVQNCDFKPMQVSDCGTSTTTTTAGSYSKTSSQDVSGLSTSSTLANLDNNCSLWSGNINGGVKEEGDFLDVGFVSHVDDDEFLNGFEFEQDTSDQLAPFLGNSPLGYFAD